MEVASKTAWHVHVQLRHGQREQGVALILLDMCFIGLNVGGREVLAGMTTRDHTEDQKLMKQRGYGLGIIGADMHGRLQNYRANQKRDPLAL